MIPGTRGYAEQLEELVPRYEAITFDQRHRGSLRFFPPPPAAVLDIGAGTGADAGWLDRRGYRVTAVEPTPPLLQRARQLHPSPWIEWIDDSLPALGRLATRAAQFDLALLTAVWMHLDADERACALPNVAALLKPEGVLALTLRHGPVPHGRLMYEVTAEETIALADAEGLRLLLSETGPPSQGVNSAAGVTWTRLVFRRSSGATR